MSEHNSDTSLGLSNQHTSKQNDVILSDSDSDLLPVSSLLGINNGIKRSYEKPTKKEIRDSISISSSEEDENVKGNCNLKSKDIQLFQRKRTKPSHSEAYSSGSEDDLPCILPNRKDKVKEIKTEAGGKLAKKRNLSAMQQQKAERNRVREEEITKKKKDKELKEREKEMTALKKRMLRETKKNATPKECMKFVTLLLDPNLLQFGFGAKLLAALQEKELKYEIQAQPQSNLITFWREVTEVKELPEYKLALETKEVVQDEILLYLPITEFMQMVQAQQQLMCGIHSEVVTLRCHIQQIKKSLENRNVTLLVQGIDKYFREQKSSTLKSRKTGTRDITLSRMVVEEVLVDIELNTDCNIRFMESDVDVMKTILQYAKSIAELPFKQTRMETGFSFYLESSGGTKVDKFGNGLTQVWRHMLQQFKNVSAEVANAILTAYPTPILLYQAYQKCSSEKEAELLLQDLVVRRGYGLLETSRKVGKEMSRRVHQLMTCTNPESIIV